MQTFVPHMAILPPAQRQLWPALASAADLGLVLYGGTAIGLRLGHRPSVDFDFFTDRPLDKEALRAALPFIERSTVLQDRPDTLTILTRAGGEGADQVKISFFGSIGFGRVGEPDMTADAVMQVASLDDLMANKLKVILQRIEAKDYTDIAALLATGVRLDTGLASARSLFGQSFQPSECLKALVYFEGGDLDTLSEDARTTLIAAASGVRDIPQVEIVSRSLALPANHP